MQTKRHNDEVFIATDAIVKVRRQDISELRRLADANSRRRARLCAHRSTADPLHEMLIILSRATYVRPHKHFNKSESFHVLEGSLEVVIFDDGGAITDVIAMADYCSGGVFYYRLADSCFHMVLPTSEQAIIHETTNGPFKREETEFAPWAPSENDLVNAQQYLEEIRRRSSGFQGADRLAG